jgi:hypothetical protein
MERDTEMACLESHLDECPGCAAYLDQMRTVIVSLGRLEPDAVPDELLWAFRNWSRDRASLMPAQWPARRQPLHANQSVHQS